MTTLIIYRGLPGSGKSSHAQAWVAENPARRARVNRDSLRGMLHGGHQNGTTERQVTTAGHAAIGRLLAAGVDVACDDTNLRQRTVRDLAALARANGADVEIRDLSNVGVEECLRRDSLRERTVGEQVIRGMHHRYLRGRALPLPVPDPEPATADLIPYQPRAGTLRAALVDIDGTVALMQGRSPYDESKVGTDRPNHPVIAVVRALAAAGTRIVFLSARTGACPGRHREVAG
jgi:predicted kinase